MKRGMLAALGVAAAGVVGIAAWLEWPEIGEHVTATDVPPTPELIEQGQYLARAGDCIACHTVPGGTPFAGGRRIETPFGDVFSSNLTPDDATGLGTWSSADFWRAMHYGKSRDGRRLYPAFPYTNLTRVTRADSDALFAYLKSLPPAASPPKPATVAFPYNTQLALRVWRALYFRPGEMTEDPQRSAQWNRGAYLVEGLGHCNACHGARTWLGGTDAAAGYSGGTLPQLGWDAPPLGADRPLTDAEAAQLKDLLQAGTSARDVTTGPMAEVVFHSLQHLRDADLTAIVDYLRTLPAAHPETARFGPLVGAEQGDALRMLGATVYREHCSDCHGADGLGKPLVYPALAANRLVTAESANNALRTVLFGGFAPSTAKHPRPYGMPPFAHQLSPTEIAAVLTYVRSAWGNDAPAVSPAAVSER
ncbi:MAG TPA: c-type cytochrome [Gammaproteobacteria bacterium]|nr:c-type cytochrome [Gammaproteobacteria bacterium]